MKFNSQRKTDLNNRKIKNHPPSHTYITFNDNRCISCTNKLGHPGSLCVSPVRAKHRQLCYPLLLYCYEFMGRGSGARHLKTPEIKQLKQKNR